MHNLKPSPGLECLEQFLEATVNGADQDAQPETSRVRILDSNSKYEKLPLEVEEVLGFWHDQGTEF